MMRMIVGLAACVFLFTGQATAAKETGSSASPVVYSNENAPKTPAPADLPLRKSVSQYGITWTFSKPVRVGQFVGGDYYVVGPVTIAEIDPKPRTGAEVTDDELDKREKRLIGEGRLPVANRVRNGSMLNPPADRKVAYDSGIKNWFDAKLVTVPPIELKPGDWLVSTISLKVGEEPSFIYHSSGVRDHHDNCPTRVAAVQTCMAEPQPPDAFRPAYCDEKNTVYLARNLRRDLLLKLERIKGAPDPVQFAEVFQKPWINTGLFSFEQPMENMPHYEQWIGQAVSNAGLLLCMDFPAEQKERLLVNFVQAGIDYWGAVKNGHPGWEGWGGHGSGRKFAIVFAGHMLGDAKMVSPTRAFPKVNFGEDNQTMYGNCWTGAKVVFTGHSGVHADGSIPRPKWGPYEHLHPSKWAEEEQRKNNQSEAYRRANSSCCWVGQTLAMRLLKLEPQWNHDAYFDYVDRWMFEDDKEFRHEINKYFPNDSLVNESKDWCHQGYTGEQWVKTAWIAWRSLSDAPTDGWQKKHDDSAYREAVEKMKLSTAAE